MTKDETKKLLFTIQAAYPSFKPDVTAAINLWSNVLEDVPLNDLMLALKAYIRTDPSGFAPSIGQLMEELRFINNPKRLSAAEAWNMVLKAVANGIYGAQEEYDKLPPDIQKSVGGPRQIYTWALCEEEYLGTVAKSNFERTYNTVCELREREEFIPPEIREVLQKDKQQFLERILSSDVKGIQWGGK